MGRAPKKTPSTPRESPDPPEEAGRESRSGQGGHRGQMGLGGRGVGQGPRQDGQPLQLGLLEPLPEHTSMGKVVAT